MEIKKTFEEHYYDAYIRPKREARARKIEKITARVLVGILAGVPFIKLCYNILN